MALISSSILDRILSLQLSVAWAGEGLCDPPRLGWWQTDLVDSAGGGDFFERIAPRTHRWAALQAAREAARRVDVRSRAAMADKDSFRSLFNLGFSVDEQLDDRLAAHKRSGRRPEEVLTHLYPIESKFEVDLFVHWLEDQSAVVFSETAVGRELRGPLSDSPEQQAAQLAAALVPPGELYPSPHFRIKK